MLQLLQSAVRRQIRVRRSPSRPELFHQLQQVQNFLLEDVSSLNQPSFAFLKPYSNFAKLAQCRVSLMPLFRIRRFALQS